MNIVITETGAKSYTTNLYKALLSTTSCQFGTRW